MPLIENYVYNHRMNFISSKFPPDYLGSTELKPDYSDPIKIISIAYRHDMCNFTFIYGEDGKQYKGSIHVMDLLSYVFELSSSK